jgi:hypothetical protein
MTMSRLQLGGILGLVLVLGSGASLAQGAFGSPQSDDSMAAAGVKGSTLLDLSVASVNDPAAVDMLFKEGNTIVSILEALNEKGFHIEYQEKQFVPAMTLLSIPTATKIDDVLREILEPWAFQVTRSPFGKLIVRPQKKSKTQATLEAKAHERQER